MRRGDGACKVREKNCFSRSDLDHQRSVESRIFVAIAVRIAEHSRRVDPVIERMMDVTVHPEGRLMRFDQVGEIRNIGCAEPIILEIGMDRLSMGSVMGNHNRRTIKALGQSSSKIGS